MNYDLFDRFIDYVLDACTNLQRTELVVSPRRVHTIGQEDVQQVVIRVHPETSTGKTGMPIDRGGSQATTGGRFTPAGYRFVEAQATAAGRAFALSKEATGLFGQILFTSVVPLIQIELQHFRQVARVGEKSGITRNTTLKSGSLVVHIATQQLAANETVVLGRDDLQRIEDVQRIIGRMPSSEPAEKRIVQQTVHRLLQLLLHHHLQQDEIDAAVFVPAAYTET